MINAYSNDVPCYIPSARVLREGGYECDSSMLYYRRPTRLAPEAEDVLCDAVQKIMPHEFYSEKLQQDFPAPKSPEESLNCMTTKPDLQVVLAASEPLIRDPVAFDWDERGRLWVVEMSDYPKGDSSASGRASAVRGNASEIVETLIALGGLTPSARQLRSGRVQMLEDTNKDGVYDKATTFLDGLAFPNGIHCWRGGVIVTMAPEIFYAEDTDGDGRADIRETMYKGFVEGNQQHRVNGLRWGLDGWLYLANGDSGGVIAGTGYIPDSSASGRASALRDNGEGNAESQKSQNAVGGLTPNRSPLNLRGHDLRINPDTNELDTVSGQTQFGRERDDFGNWFGNNNSNPIWQYVLEDRYLRRNPHAGISQVTAQVSVIPGAAPVYPTSRTLARFNDFSFANRFTSACSTMIYRDNCLGDQYYGNAFTSEPVHNLVSRLVLTRDGYGFKGERAADEHESEFLASSDNWFRPTMIRTGPDGAIWVADMYRAAIEHPEWIPPEYQRKMNLYAGNDRGRIYRIVPASECCNETPASGGRDEDSRSRLPSGTVAPTRTESGMPQSATDKRERSLRPPESGVATSLVAGRSEAAKSFPAERTYFDQPWNEIPIADLVKRLESPNGWWRDTAQRILMHRGPETMIDPLNFILSRESQDKNPGSAVVAQSLEALYAMWNRDSARDLMIVERAIASSEAQVRRLTPKFAEGRMRSGDPDGLNRISKLAEDPDAAVRLQVMLSLGEANGDSGAALLGKMLHENFDDTFLRSAGLTSLNPDNINGVLNTALSVSTDEMKEELIGVLLGQAAAMGKGESIAEPLMRLVISITAEAPASHFDLIGETLRKTQSGKTSAKLKLNPQLQLEMNDAGQTAMITVKNASAEADRRAAALRFAEIAGSVDSTSVGFAELLEPQTPMALQIAAVNIVVRNGNDASIKLLLASLHCCFSGNQRSMLCWMRLPMKL